MEDIKVEVAKNSQIRVRNIDDLDALANLVVPNMGSSFKGEIILPLECHIDYDLHQRPSVNSDTGIRFIQDQLRDITLKSSNHGAIKFLVGGK